MTHNDPTISAESLLQAAAFVESVAPYWPVHTVTLELNGQHGQVDLFIDALDEEGASHRWEYRVQK